MTPWMLAAVPIVFILAASNLPTAPSSSCAISPLAIPASPSIPASPFSPATVTKRSPDANPQIDDSHLLLSCPAPVFAEKLQITSNPSGATVELDGVAVGSTPFEKDFPGGYFRKTRTSIGSRLEHPVVARISLSGYATREIKLTEGP